MHRNLLQCAWLLLALLDTVAADDSTTQGDHSSIDATRVPFEAHEADAALSASTPSTSVNSTRPRMTPVGYAEAFRRRYCANLPAQDHQKMLEMPFDKYVQYLKSAKSSSRSTKCHTIKRHLCAKAYVVIELTPNLSAKDAAASKRFIDTFFKDIHLYSHYCKV